MSKKAVLLWMTVMLSATVSCSGEDINPDPLIAEDEITETTEDGIKVNSMNIKVGDQVLTATLVNNSSVDALIKALSDAPITVEMRDYGNMEKVGPLGRELPRNDEQITTEAGDIILYQGNALVIYYAPNS